MCLRLKKRFRSRELAIKYSKTPIVSKIDIKVYKTIQPTINDENIKQYFTPYRWKLVDFNEPMKTPNFSFDYNIAVNLSFLQKLCGFDYAIDIEQGIHAYSTLKRAEKAVDLFYDLEIFEMYIPKDTPYFIGENDDIVALQLNWKDK